MRELNFELRRYTTNFFAMLDVNCAKYNLTGKQMMVLSHIGRNINADRKYVNQQDIEKSFGINRSSVTSILKNLEKTGYIEKIQDENDSRRKLLTLTDEGNKIFFEGKAFIIQLEEKIKNSFSDEDFFILKKYITKLAEISETL